MKKKLRKKLDHHIDVEFCQESISDVFRAIGALLRPLERYQLYFSLVATGPWESESHLVKWPEMVCPFIYKLIVFVLKASCGNQPISLGYPPPLVFLPSRTRGGGVNPRSGRRPENFGDFNSKTLQKTLLSK